MQEKFRRMNHSFRLVWEQRAGGANADTEALGAGIQALRDLQGKLLGGLPAPSLRRAEASQLARASCADTSPRHSERVSRVASVMGNASSFLGLRARGRGSQGVTSAASSGRTNMHETGRASMHETIEGLVGMHAVRLSRASSRWPAGGGFAHLARQAHSTDSELSLHSGGGRATAAERRLSHPSQCSAPRRASAQPSAGGWALHIPSHAIHRGAVGDSIELVTVCGETPAPRSTAQLGPALGRTSEGCEDEALTSPADAPSPPNLPNISTSAAPAAPAAPPATAAGGSASIDLAALDLAAGVVSAAAAPSPTIASSVCSDSADLTNGQSTEEAASAVGMDFMAESDAKGGSEGTVEEIEGGLDGPSLFALASQHALMDTVANLAESQAALGRRTEAAEREHRVAFQVLAAKQDAISAQLGDLVTQVRELANVVSFVCAMPSPTGAGTDDGTGTGTGVVGRSPGSPDAAQPSRRVNIGSRVSAGGRRRLGPFSMARRSVSGRSKERPTLKGGEGTASCCCEETLSASTIASRISVASTESSGLRM